MAEAHESPPLLVPESKGQRLEARWQRDGFDSLEVRVCVMAALEMVIRDARTQVMNMMKADIAGKPLQDFRELIEGTAVKRGARIVPILSPRPVCAFELVLHVEELHAQRPSKRCHGQLNQ